MGDLKTTLNDTDVDAFIDALDDPARRDDCRTLRALMAQVTGDPGAMWGSSIIGFGSYRYRYASGREGTWFQVGFSPRKRNLTLYIMDGFADREAVLARLGPHMTGKSCLYVRRLADIDVTVLGELIRRSVAHVTATQPPG